MVRNFVRFGAAAAFALLVSASAPAFGSMIDIGGGWSVTTPSGFDGSIYTDFVSDELVMIEVSKDFHAPIGDDGTYPPIELLFMQIADDANTAPRIVIADETVTNLTGSTWTDFHWTIDSEGLNAWFNTDPMSEYNSLGFTTSPFVNHAFGGYLDAPGTTMATELSADGGQVPDTASFFPGNGSGELIIDVDLSDKNGASFLFSQFPTPEPSLLLAMLMAAPIVLGRLRR